MPFDYLSAFPIPADVLPDKLRKLIEPVGFSPKLQVDVACLQESEPHGLNSEHVHMLMAVVIEDGNFPLAILDEAGNGVVEYSVPVGDIKGCSKNFSPTMSGHDYVVAAWGDGSFYTFNLAEKVWMALGLTPRCVGNDHQRLIYDDLGLPEFGVAEGEISSEYYFTSKRNISWTMSNEYLRKYLWLRGARGVRAFYYQAQMQDIPKLRELMNGEAHIVIKPIEGVEWFELDIQEHKGGLLMQVWASVDAVTCELCPEQSAEGIIWPGMTEPMTHARADSLLVDKAVYLNDKFLEKYEQSSFYNTTPVNIYGSWHCSPSYKGQWSFTDCVRVGRNLVRVPMRELYKPKPDREILQAYAFALSDAEVAHFELNAEHIVSKTKRLLDQILNLGDNLSKLGAIVGVQKSSIDLVGFSRAELSANGWGAHQNLCRLAQVAPLDMTQQSFLARCKSMHEIWQCVPNGYLKSLLENAGCPRGKIKELGSLKLLQAVLNIIQRLNVDEDAADAFSTDKERDGWDERNAALSYLFLNNDLRIADAHEAVGGCLATLQLLGFDTANVNDGYGRALDFVMDGVIDALATFNEALDRFLRR